MDIGEYMFKTTSKEPHESMILKYWGIYLRTYIQNTSPQIYIENNFKRATCILGF